jgi:hypothetical protein
MERERRVTKIKEEREGVINEKEKGEHRWERKERERESESPVREEREKSDGERERGKNK